VRSDRRFSQAISEGDGISVIVDVGDPDAARSAAAQGAEALAVRGREVGDLRAVTELPILWRASGSPSEAALAGADAWLVAVGDAGEDGEWLARQHAEALELGLDCVVEVRNEEQLELALERLDPEIFLLAARADGDPDALSQALELLPDIPAGKLAVADLPASSREEVDELERAGVDAVIVGTRNVAELVGDAPPQV
jgi:NAD(P)H-dependent flavin oxidoreductase YrpB (nitropropane dioxygenase family)